MPEMKDYLNFHSDEVQDIMIRQPLWIIRWGITLLIIILLGIIIACCLIRYPQTTIASITLTMDNPTSNLTARYTGILDSISVTNGDSVYQGQILALIANAADYEDVQWVEELLKTNTILEDDIIRITQSPERVLGDIQPYWENLKTICGNYSDYLSIDQIGKKKKLLARQVQQTREYLALLREQKKSLEKEMHLEHQAVIRDSMLYSKDAISKAEFENTSKSFYFQKNNLDGFEATLSNAQLSQLQLEQQIFELDIQQSSEKADYLRAISQAKGALIGEISVWKELYAIISPYDGTVSLHNVWSKGQYVETGDVIASVNPIERSEILGRLEVPSSGFGRVKIGQEVNIKLNGFPYLEFGIIKGVVCSISAVPERLKDGLFYMVDVKLTKGLESTYHITLPFVQDMDGTAEIITDDMRLIEQFLRPIKSLFVNK